MLLQLLVLALKHVELLLERLKLVQQLLNSDLESLDFLAVLVDDCVVFRLHVVLLLLELLFVRLLVEIRAVDWKLLGRQLVVFKLSLQLLILLNLLFQVFLELVDLFDLEGLGWLVDLGLLGLLLANQQLLAVRQLLLLHYFNHVEEFLLLGLHLLFL